jgi:hypothetical protein
MPPLINNKLVISKIAITQPMCCEIEALSSSFDISVLITSVPEPKVVIGGVNLARTRTVIKLTIN